ncbi:MFS transporter [Candidatus Spongiihabitans sp.]|uniref:MFS transporter n=1 Tax=Candidatus Spongiihabitans sp. TaxID=3101308 RepID=UPI003C7BDA15
MLTTAMSPTERTAVFALASIFSLRMFGLFMLLPVLAIYADELSGTTPLLLGLALGVYGLTQAIFQLPFGLLSDRIERKKVIACGLIIFAAGSIIAALADSIQWLIIGRAVQGAGAISAAVLALNADLTRSEQRTKSMAIIGISIGFTFLMSLILAPILQSVIGVDGLFWLIAVLAIMAIGVLYKVVPGVAPSAERDQHLPPRDRLPGHLEGILKNSQLMQLNFGILILHLVLTALFLVLPNLLITQSGLLLSEHWKLYTPILLASVLGMMPFIIAGSKPKFAGIAYQTAISLLLISLITLAVGRDYSLAWLLASITLFFSAFNALESLLPSLVSQLAPANSKGAAIGIYNTFQFSGIFLGGLAGGWILGMQGVTGVFVFCSVAVFGWLLVSCFAAHFNLTKNNRNWSA